MQADTRKYKWQTNDMLENPQPQMISYMMASLRTMSQKVHLPTCCPTAACFTAFICSAVELLPHYYISVGLHCIDHASPGLLLMFLFSPSPGQRNQTHLLETPCSALPDNGVARSWASQSKSLRLAASKVMHCAASRLDGTYVQFRCVTTGMHQILKFWTCLLHVAGMHPPCVFRLCTVCLNARVVTCFPHCNELPTKQNKAVLHNVP